MQSGTYFEYLCWDLRQPLQWGNVASMTINLPQQDRVELESALDLIQSMTERTFNQGGDNASLGNLAMTMETRGGSPYFGGAERDWNNVSEGFAAITLTKAKYLDALRSVGFLTEIEIQSGYFEVRTHLGAIAPIADKLLREQSATLS